MRRASIPLPIPCEGITLPFELHTHFCDELTSRTDKGGNLSLLINAWCWCSVSLWSHPVIWEIVWLLSRNRLMSISLRWTYYSTNWKDSFKQTTHYHRHSFYNGVNTSINDDGLQTGKRWLKGYRSFSCFWNSLYTLQMYLYPFVM